MYYVAANLPHTNNWQNTSQVEDWQKHHNRNHAINTAWYWAQGWVFLDIQDAGNRYKVHFRDNHGHYKTVFIDFYFRFQEVQSRYC